MGKYWISIDRVGDLVLGEDFEQWLKVYDCRTYDQLGDAEEELEREYQREFGSHIGPKKKFKNVSEYLCKVMRMVYSKLSTINHRGGKT